MNRLENSLERMKMVYLSLWKDLGGLQGKLKMRANKWKIAVLQNGSSNLNFLAIWVLRMTHVTLLESSSSPKQTKSLQPT